MKDFAKSIVCNTKAEADKVGNFEDPKDAKRYIQMWERRKQDAKSWIDDANRKLKELHKDHGGAFGSLSESEKRSHKAEAQRHEDTIRKYQAEFEKYDNLIKQAQKSTWGNTRTGNAVPGTWVKKSAMDGPIQEKDFNGYSLVVQEDTDGKKKWWSWYIYKGNSEIAGGEESSEGSAKARAEHWLEHSVPMPTNRTGNTNKAGNTKVGNADILSGNYIILADNGEVWFRDEHENVHIRNIDSWAQKKIAEYQRSIDEIKKGVQEAKQQAKKFGLI